MKLPNFIRICAVYASVMLAMSSHAVLAQSKSESKGAYLARAADCVACHSVPNGKPFAGGLKMGTPLGNIFSTNITPDRQTGIGSYSLADFDRAVRKGVAKDGHRLYPAMPYPSYAKISDSDLAALYDYFMHDVALVHQMNRASEIEWPMNARWPLAAWNALFVDSKPYTTEASHDAVWNRGAYLVQGLGHCGACHTSRGLLFQERALDESDSRFLGGATLDGWTASNLRGNADTGLGRWSEDEIVAFLKNGVNGHASVFGSMIDVYNNSSQFLSESDQHAIAVYLKSLTATPGGKDTYTYSDATAKALQRGDITKPGAAVFRTQCASCHGMDGKGLGDGLPSLAGNPNVLSNDPSSVINLILNGAQRVVRKGMPDTYRMAPFRLQLNDQQIADVATWIRQAWGNQAGAVTRADVGKLRASTNMSTEQVVILKMR
ncbi:Gluconate 2-dehydrogenase cytochrome c subunit [Paraburkholderia piptadeniae]|uniref:Gluconate 2-dehydrogenase cytochrome c subunit n=1 Tax=Paraburkholderia piptadeniae TaxID=1701573 RepID=A0A1N7S063_9BURK|nr:cytochrome c [Paraburkholderia piptadeniae]SIT40789.1 Gluconate 2-dehydrogenase cytochrome c subunit [Paraburkholderia piptadeniae]